MLTPGQRGYLSPHGKYELVTSSPSAPSPSPRPGRAIAPAGPPPVPGQAGGVLSKILLASLAGIVLTVSGVGYATVGRLGQGLTSVTDLSLGNNEQNEAGQAADGAVDILLVGSDSRTDAQGNALSEAELAALNAGVADGVDNTDTIMLIRVPNDGSRATAVSIPRDTYIHDAEFGNMKINGVYSTHKNATYEVLYQENLDADAAGQPLPHSEESLEQDSVAAGRRALIAALHELTGISIDHYAEVGLVGFTLLTDAVGGVDVCLINDVSDEFSGANFHAGVQTLSGPEALAFVRQRYGLPRGDLDRIVRQQAFMASLVSKVLEAGTLTNPATLARLGDAVERSVVIDEDWDIMSFATQLANLAGGNVTFNTIPVTSVDGVGDYGESIVTVDHNEVHRFFEELARSHDPEQAPAEDIQPEDDAAPVAAVPVADGLEFYILNAGSFAGHGNAAAGWLSTVGYTVAEISPAQPGIYTTSQLVVSDPTDPAVLALAEQLGGLPITANAGINPGSIVLVVHDDYPGPLDESIDLAADAPSPEAVVGTPGADFGHAEVSPEIDAGGSGPRCVN